MMQLFYAHYREIGIITDWTSSERNQLSVANSNVGQGPISN